MIEPTREHIEALIRSVAAMEGLDPELSMNQCAAESSFEPDAVSRCGAQGLFQLMPKTAQYLRVKDPFDWIQNVIGGLHYMGVLLRKYSDTRKAYAAYNCGPGRLDRITHTFGVEWEQHLPAETKSYLRKIIG